MKHTVRTFIAVEIGAEIRQRAEGLIAQLAQTPADVKWVAAQQLHLTLKFLGEVNTREVSRICDAVAAATAKLVPFALEVRGAGAFPNAQRPRTVWLGVGQGEAEMVALHERVDRRLGKLGFRAEHRRFQPHLTLGRVRRGGPGVGQLGELLGQQADFAAGTCRVGEVTVFSSDLGPAGPTYAVLGRAKLAGK